MILQRQHFLLSYLKTLSVGPVGVSNSRPPASQPGAQPSELPVRGDESDNYNDESDNYNDESDNYNDLVLCVEKESESESHDDCHTVTIQEGTPLRSGRRVRHWSSRYADFVP